MNIPVYKSKKKKYKEILVLSGGGVKGVAHLGALKALEENGYLDKFQTYAGTSIGAIILALYLIGYTPDEQYEFVRKFDLTKLKNIDVGNIFQNFGLDNGERFEYVLRRLIQAKNYNPEITLKELYDKTKKKLVLTSTCLNDAKLCYLSYENHPNLTLCMALRMTSAIPLFFTPIKYNNCMYCDGGCVDNYPVKLFEDKLQHVVGIHINDVINDTQQNINNLESFIVQLFKCFANGLTYNSKKAYEKYTIEINLDMMSVIDFSIDDKKKEQMFTVGYDATVNNPITNPVPCGRP
jgi:NTE family protein